jgi:N-acetylmuramoyl-L-alanine amidase
MITLDGVDIPTDFAAAWADGYREKRWPARKPDALHGIVLHETAGPTAGSALNAWRAGSVGADFLIDLDGRVLQCADPIRSAPWHAEVWSPRHVGIETVCPVTDRSPYSKPPGGEWTDPWRSKPRSKRAGVFSALPAHLGKGLYLAPFTAQLTTLCQLVDFLRANVPTLADASAISSTAERLRDRAPRAGIVAHAQVSLNRLDGYGPLAALCTHDLGAA